MKKIIVLIAAALLSVAAFAQPRAIGGRLAGGFEFSYQHTLGAANFAEIDLGYNLGSGLGVTAIYDFVIAQPYWTPKGNWDFYAGPGVSVGTYFADLPFAVGICGQVGLSYTFWFPLQLSFDIRPSVGIGVGGPNGISFNSNGLAYGLVPTFGVRYSFGR